MTDDLAAAIRENDIGVAPWAVASSKRTVRLVIPGMAYGPAARNGGHLRAAERRWQDAIAEAGQVALADRSPWQGPVELTIRLAFAPPKSWTKARRGANGLWKVTPPRLENSAKLVLAALEGVLFVDQAQVCRLELSKFYADTPGTIIRATEAAASGEMRFDGPVEVSLRFE